MDYRTAAAKTDGPVTPALAHPAAIGQDFRHGQGQAAPAAQSRYGVGEHGRGRQHHRHRADCGLAAGPRRKPLRRERARQRLHGPRRLPGVRDRHGGRAAGARRARDCAVAEVFPAVPEPAGPRLLARAGTARRDNRVPERALCMAGRAARPVRARRPPARGPRQPQRSAAARDRAVRRAADRLRHRHRGLDRRARAALPPRLCARLRPPRPARRGRSAPD